MTRLAELAGRHPVLAYIVLCYGITWPVWFGIPLLAGSEWALLKILTGFGFGPALAAIALDRIRGTAGRLGTFKWWTYFAVTTLVVAAISTSILLTGDAMQPGEIAAAEPVGLTSTGVIGCLLAAAMAGFILASVACSRSPRLASLVAWRLPLRWWMVTLFLPATLLVTGLGITLATGGEPPDSPGHGLSVTTWAAFLVRSTLATLLIVAVGEEPGWRGCMLPDLQRRFSPLVSSVLLGIVWGLWHFPLFVNGLYPGGPVLVVAKVIACVPLAVIFTWLYNRTGGNLLLAVILHTSLNNTPRLLPATGWMALLALGLVVALVVCDRMWRGPGRSRPRPALGPPTRETAARRQRIADPAAAAERRTTTAVEPEAP